MLIRIVLFSDDDSEETHQLPAKNEVCSQCEGTGFVLCEGMRGHAYSAEEFHESFDDEEAEEYMKRGGRYDVRCPSCEGANVVLVVDEKRLTESQKKIFEAWDKQESQRVQSDYEDRMTMRAENGWRDD